MCESKAESVWVLCRECVVLVGESGVLVGECESGVGSV